MAAGVTESLLLEEGAAGTSTIMLSVPPQFRPGSFVWLYNSLYKTTTTDDDDEKGDTSNPRHWVGCVLSLSSSEVSTVVDDDDAAARRSDDDSSKINSCHGKKHPCATLCTLKHRNIPPPFVHEGLRFVLYAMMIDFMFFFPHSIFS